MIKGKTARQPAKGKLSKCPTGITGLDELTGGGLPRGRPTLVSGSAGCGKTLLAVEFLVRGATQFGEPGVFLAFEETAEELAANVESLGFDLPHQQHILVDHVYIERSEIEETGEYDLEGLFVRLEDAIESIGAKRVVLDTIEALFCGLANTAVLRAELRRLFRWLKTKGVTVIVTGEQQPGARVGHGLEEYVSDCVIVLDHRVSEQVSTRRLRIVKYRGSSHGTNEYPFLIDSRGLVVLPVTSLRLEHDVPTERVSSGIAGLDEMLSGEGYFRGSSVLISGTAGTGKTSVASHFAAAACRRGERCLYFAFEESSSQLIRNMGSIGVDLQPWVKKGRLHFNAARPTLHGLEMHLTKIHQAVLDLRPRCVVVDPITDFLSVGSVLEVESMLMRLVDFLKSHQVTALFTCLTSYPGPLESTVVGISSLIDTWLLVRDVEQAGERNRGICILKSRGMAHSNKIREFRITNQGIELADVYLGADGALMGATRQAHEAQDRASALRRRQALERKRRHLERRREALEADLAALQMNLAATEPVVPGAARPAFPQGRGPEDRAGSARPGQGNDSGTRTRAQGKGGTDRRESSDTDQRTARENQGGRRPRDLEPAAVRGGADAEV